MRARRILLTVAIVLFCAGARRRVVPAPEHRAAPLDIFSAAQPLLVQSKHLTLDLAVDLEAQRIRGSVTHEIEAQVFARKFIVDTNGLEIENVTADGRSTAWSFGTPASNGTPLIIDIEPSTHTVRIDYSTKPDAVALRWLTAKQTRDGVMPAMWSNSEPDMVRSWIPLQDTPSVRITYDATVRVPPGLMALMSASNNPTSANETGIYHFSMPYSIPPYLIALTVARYEYRALGNRTGVYAEPGLLDETVYEMHFLPDMMSAAERIIGPYPFDRYDLVFPPKYNSGMENAQLNFIGQELVSGNHDPVVPPHTVVAHELAHSWFGDMVTLATWSDVWLNEGFATYYEKRIMEEVHSWERAEAGLYSDRRALETYLAAKPAPRVTILHRTFNAGERPSFTIIPYQKGEMFLKMLEDTMGRATFDAFIRRYRAANRFHWVDDISFRNALVEATAHDPELQARLRIDEWIYASGLPENVTAPTYSALWGRLEVEANRFKAGTMASALDRTGWTYVEIQFFLQLIEIPVSRLTELDNAFGFSRMNSPPLLWLVTLAKSPTNANKAEIERYLARGSGGSLAVWQTLAGTTAGRTFAIELFSRYRDRYDAVTARQIATFLNVSSAMAAAA